MLFGIFFANTPVLDLANSDSSSATAVKLSKVITPFSSDNYKDKDKDKDESKDKDTKTKTKTKTNKSPPTN